MKRKRLRDLRAVAKAEAAVIAACDRYGRFVADGEEQSYAARMCKYRLIQLQSEKQALEQEVASWASNPSNGKEDES